MKEFLEVIPKEFSETFFGRILVDLSLQTPLKKIVEEISGEIFLRELQEESLEKKSERNSEVLLE